MILEEWYLKVCFFFIILPCAHLESRLLYFYIQHLTSRKVVLLSKTTDNLLRQVLVDWQIINCPAVFSYFILSYL